MGVSRFPLLTRSTVPNDILYLACDRHRLYMDHFLASDGYTSAEGFAKLRSNEHGQETYILKSWHKTTSNGTTTGIMVVLDTGRSDDEQVEFDDGKVMMG
jgi:hypothetical protein